MPERLESANKQLASKTQENQESNQGTVAKLLAQSKSLGARLHLAPLRQGLGAEAFKLGEEAAGAGWELFALPRGGLCCSGRWTQAINPGRPAG